MEAARSRRDWSISVTTKGGFYLFATKHEIDGGKSHRSDACKNCHFTAVYNLHLVLVAAGCGMVIGVHGTDNT